MLTATPEEMATAQKKCHSKPSVKPQKLLSQGMKSSSLNAGTEDARITYTSTTPLGAVITGAEPVKTWAPYEGNVWVCRVKNSMFGSYNPYTTYVMGDWYFAPVTKHTGAVYLNDRALYEADTLEDCLHPSV